VLDELAARGAPFVGCLYAGLMLTEQGPRVLEFNCRLGDPETQVVLPRLESDVLELIWSAATGRLDRVDVAVSASSAVSVVLASAGYPESAGEVGVPLDGLDAAEADGAIVFHAGTALREDTLLSAGGRVLNVTALGDTLGAARERVYRAIEHIDFPGMQYRRDIALRAARVSA